MIARIVLGLAAVFAVVPGVIVTVLLVSHFRGGQVDDISDIAFFTKLPGPLALGIWAAGRIPMGGMVRAEGGAFFGILGIPVASLLAYLISFAFEPGVRELLKDGLCAPLWITPGLFFLWAAVKSEWPVPEEACVG